MPTSKARAEQPRREWEDYGLFGPDSPSWQVWTASTALLGFQRSVVLEHFDPFLAAAVRVHAKATGIEPISGQRYSANNPASQLWIHVTGWHSVLKCYEMYGPGPLSERQEQRYWDDCVVAAELQTCKPADVPSCRARVREYFAEVRPRLCSSERAERAMHYLLRTPRAQGKFALWAGSRLMARSTIATLPRWMRQMGRFEQSAAVDRAILAPTRAAIRATGSPKAKLAILRGYAPLTGQVLRQHLYGEPRPRAETITPARARELYGPAAKLRAEAMFAGR